MTFTSTLSGFWSARAPRERRILLAGATFLAALILYLLLVEPAARGIVRLQRLLPQTRTQASRLETLVSEARSLRTLAPVATPVAADARSALDKSLRDAGLKSAHSTVLSNGDLHVSFVNVAYGRWTTWLFAAERTLGVHAVAVSVKASEAAGNADIELSLRLPRA
ncbi:MAG TPA: type II secretion system protein GspM [Burkholderiaceae bacterium]|nr:type II secretion system protein GspM [Burkholderiaceae bacterium]